MKRLIRKAEQTYTYKLKTHGVVKYEDNFDNSWEYKLTSDFEYSDELEQAIDADSYIDFVEYMDGYGDELDKTMEKLVSVKISLNSDNTLCTTVIAKEELTNEDKALIKDYMIGQFSDGWGEGFEQHEIASYTDYDNIQEWDEDEQDYYYDEEEINVNLYVSWWDSKGLTLTKWE